MPIKIYEIDPENFCSAPGLAWKATLKKAKVKLDLLTGIDILLMVEKRIGGGICHSVDWYTKTNNKNIWKIMIKIKNCHIFNIGM